LKLKHYLLFLLFFPLSVWSQSGKLLYEQTQKFEYGNRDWTITQQWELIFNDSIAICRYVKPKLETTSAGGMQVGRWIPDRKDFFITLLDSQTVHDLYEFEQKFYQVTGPSAQAIQWKFTGKQGLVESYPCIEAIFTKDGDTTLAWFSPRLPVSAGPLYWRGLPGLILHMERNGGKEIITLKNIDLNYAPKPEDFVVEWPRRTTPITYVEMLKMLYESQKKNRELFGR
jgi:GLPGLI family protein